MSLLLLFNQGTPGGPVDQDVTTEPIASASAIHAPAGVTHWIRLPIWNFETGESQAVIYKPTITPGPALATGTTISSASVPYAPSVSQITIATAGVRSLFAFWMGGGASGSVGVQTIGLPVISPSTAQLFALTVTVGPVAVTTSTRPSALAMNAPTVTAAGAVAVTVIATTAQVFGPTLAAGPVTVTGGTRVSTVGLTPPTVSPGPVTGIGATRPSTLVLSPPSLTAGAVTVTMGTIVATSLVRLPVISQGAVIVQVPALASGAQVFVVTVVPGAVGLTTAAFGPTGQVFLPIVSLAGVVNVGTTAIASTALVRAVSVTTGPVSVTTAHRATTAQVTVPTLSVIALGATIPKTSGVNAPTVRYQVTTATRVSTSQVFLPAIAAAGSTSVGTVFCASTSVVSAPTVASAVALVGLSTVPSGSAVFQPGVMTPATIGLAAAHRSSALVVYPLTVRPVVITNEVGTTFMWLL